MAEEEPDDIPEIETAPITADDDFAIPDVILGIETGEEWRTGDRGESSEGD